MSTPEQPPRSSDGHSESQDSPEGLLLTTYAFHIKVSADFLKTMEALAWRCGMDKGQFDHAVFTKGLEALMLEVHSQCDPEHLKELISLAPLGTKARVTLW